MKIYGWTPPFMQGQIQAGMQGAQGSLLLEFPNIRYDRRETQIECFSSIDTIGNTIFSALLQIRKKNNRADTDSIYKQIIKTIDFADVTREFLDEIIHY